MQLFYINIRCKYCTFVQFLFYLFIEIFYESFKKHFLFCYAIFLFRFRVFFFLRPKNLFLNCFYFESAILVLTTCGDFKIPKKKYG